MAKTADAITQAETINAVFDDEAAAREAVTALERAGMPPDRIGLVMDNIRQAREVAGSRSPQGAVVGAVLGVLVVVAFVILGGEQIREPIAIAMGGFAIVGAFTFIGWLAGRARVLKEEKYDDAEDDSASGEILVSVVCDTPDGADTTRAILERAGARDIRGEDSAESV